MFLAENKETTATPYIPDVADM